MKKFLCGILCLTLIFALCGCGKTNSDVSSDSSNSISAVSSQVSSATSSTSSKTSSATGSSQVSTPPVTSSKVSSTISTSSTPEVKAITLAEITAKMDNSKDYLITFVGDSITFGHPVSNVEDRYVSLVAKGLASKYTDRTIIRYDGIENGLRNPLKEYAPPVTVQEGEEGKITVVRSGVSGSRMGDTLSRAETDFLGTAGGRLPKAADLIIINLGVNDAGDLGAYKRDMRALVEKIMSTQSKTDVVLMTPTSSGSNRLQDFSAAMKELAKEKGLAVIDLNSEWQKYYTAGEYNNGFGKYMSDNWHPSTLGHKVIAAKILGDLIGE